MLFGDAASSQSQFLYSRLTTGGYWLLSNKHNLYSTTQYTNVTCDNKDDEDNNDDNASDNDRGLGWRRTRE